MQPADALLTHCSIGQNMRQAGAAALAIALRHSREDTLRLLGAYQAARPDLRVPMRPEFNPPLWELGHIGWFQDWWLGRFSARRQGAAADPDLPRLPACHADADALYNSSLVPHDSRWALPLPSLAATCDNLEQQLQRTLALLAQAGDSDDALYFYRLVLLHEDMHHEAGLYMAQALDVPVHDPRWQPPPLPPPGAELALPAGRWRLGSDGPGFAFDNELAAHEVLLPASRIDAQVLRWAEFLPFVDAGGYQQPRWWSEQGWHWRQQQCERPREQPHEQPHERPHGQQDEPQPGQPGGAGPRYLRQQAGHWQQRRHGLWCALDPSLPACHLSAHEAQAWCAWAGRRLPSEAEWERAALSEPAHFQWGAVWEWTASTFGAYPGFVAHPYRDYSAPWFGDRPVLRGASFATQPRMKHPRYRNYFMAGRNDIFAGFRSCAL